MDHTLTERWQKGNEAPIEVEQTFTADGEDNRDLTIADSTTDQLVTMAIDVSLLKLLYIYSDQDITIETNDGSAPDDTLSVTAGVPIIWHANSIHDNPLTTDVDGLYMTNASGATANVKIRVLQDSTP